MFVARKKSGNWPSLESIGTHLKNGEFRCPEMWLLAEITIQNDLYVTKIEEKSYVNLVPSLPQDGVHRRLFVLLSSVALEYSNEAFDRISPCSWYQKGCIPLRAPSDGTFHSQKK